MSLIGIGLHLIISSCASSVSHLSKILVLWLTWSTGRTPTATGTVESTRKCHRSRSIEHIKSLGFRNRDIHWISICSHGSHKLKHLLLLSKLFLLGRRIRTSWFISHIHGNVLLLLRLVLMATGTAFVTATVVAQIDQFRYFGRRVFANILRILANGIISSLPAIAGCVGIVAEKIAQMAMMLLLLLLLRLTGL